MTTVVVGAGPAGAAAAAAAARRGERTWLVGRTRDHPCGTLEILSGRARGSLVALGWYDAVVARARPCDAIVSRWADDAYIERPALLEPGGLGWIVDRAWFDPLLRELAARDGVEEVANGAETPAGARRVLATGKHAPSSGTRRMLGPDLLALTATMPGGSMIDLASRLLVDVADDGWWSAVDDGTLAAVTFTTDVAQLPDGPDLPRRAWARTVASGPSWLPSAADKTVPRVRPIRSRLHLEAPGAVVRVGDAALSVDPLSGHGLALALEGAMRYTEPDYPSWLREQADAHELAGRTMYEAVPCRSPFWRRHTARLRPPVPRLDPTSMSPSRTTPLPAPLSPPRMGSHFERHAAPGWYT